MLRSLFTGISGLSVHQTMLDVTANNIANVNTTGFKSASTRFEDTFSQLVRSGAAPRLNERGGMNPAQVGLGVKLQSITNNFTGGAAQNTGRNLDTMINGDGFFVLRKSNGTSVYTRNGSFGLDAQGQVVAADGSFVQGWMANADGTVNATGQPGNVILPLTNTMEAKATKKVVFGGNMPADQRLNDPTQAANEGNAFVRQQVLRVYDDKGDPHNILMHFVRTDYDKANAADTGSHWGVAFYDEEAFNAINSDKLADKEDARIEIEGLDKPVTFGGVDLMEIAFDSQGQLSEDDRKALEGLKFDINQFKITNNPDGTVTIDKGDKLAAEAVNLNMSQLTGFGGINNFQVSQSDGNAAGTMTGFSIEADGTIRGTFSNGDTRPLAKVAIAAFANPLGLEKAGSSYFVESGNSGQPQIGEAGTGTRGSMTGGAIEMSNVDLAAEFTNLILSQRGFQANSRIITTSDEILQELVNMKR
ncbi:MAG: flagellar hook protein FlgE [Mobiluncus porci]|uniref:Flagellar hook protein FlgE n=1 Tax=Mobiluncus porci TaxID=2652278 RepID=A0A7K0K4P3_9ACTO|nr:MULTISPECIES: flagellar hook protein FlgE [Mobiluncus]MCI6584707.1 flagellar hook protein FlgE [Mobiluncus sp.]MDD7540986.1 flagellar hook protein FlgE [Mobiluncus porci]MDY5748161.1 flagellar hook protein FlgE [Mobiluncus porci]MST50005.1 flagellar hook protein FlgE [Mobiluncus porci]